ncbi:MAG: flagellar hook-length control protein FliK [Amaricoccus sp.]
MVASDGAAGPGTDPTAPAMLHQGAPRAAGAAAPAAAPPAGDRPLVLDPAAPVSWHLARSAEPAQRDAAPPPPSPTSPHPLVAQIAVAVSRSPERHLEIRLDPPELGRVQIHLTPQDGGVQAVVLADRPETQDLLRRHAEALARELGDAGYGNVTLDFAAGRQATPERRDEGATALALVGTGRIPEATPAPVAAPARATLSGALDIRL